MAGSAHNRSERADAPKLWFCREKQRLTDQLLEAIHELTVLHDHQAQSVIDSDLDFPSFDILLHLAQEKKNDAKYAWIEHVELHRCAESAEFTDLQIEPSARHPIGNRDQPSP
jgi:hypothetical protein